MQSTCDNDSFLTEADIVIMTLQEFFHHLDALGPDPSPDPESKTSRWWKILVPICLYCLNCTKFGELILRKIIKIITTRCQILRLKCAKFNFGGPDPLTEITALPRPLAGF